MFEVLAALVICFVIFFTKSYILGIVLLGVFLVIVAPGFYAMSTGAPYVPSHDSRVKGMLELGKFKKGDRVYELGCGDGRVIRRIAKMGVEKAVGYEFSIPTYILARVKTFFGRGKEKIKFGNFWKQDFSDADAIVCYLMENSMGEVEKKIWPQLKKGARVVSNEFVFKEVPHEHKSGLVYLYVKK